MRLINRVDEKTAGSLIQEVDVIVSSLGIPGEINHIDFPVTLRHIPGQHPVLHLSRQIHRFSVFSLLSHFAGQQTE